MLLNRISQVRETVVEYNQLNKKNQQARRVGSFSKFSRDELKKCKDILGSYQALHEVDEELFPKSNMSIVLIQLEALSKGGLEKYNRDDIIAFSRPFKTLDDDLKLRWMNYVRNKNQDTIKLLQQMQNIVSNKQEIKQLVDELKKFENKWPITSNVVNRYHEHHVNAKKIISDMQASNGVQDFIGKVAANNATLDDLTDEVILWLREQQLTNKLVIKFK
ncbi:hypothetical protein [Cytobacillus firmus]|uniref:hypothetical protein n=1 Tax=Cytobacillus firmus TaxID=1399 RepID=UPI00216118B6|nr:hypothetical protein [Cytobacillus firmus]MCS0674470.1 hypothetical protein [Cytobacillus firmus]